MIKLSATLCLCLLSIVSHAQTVKVTDIKETDFTQFETFNIQMGEFAIPGEDRKISSQEFHGKLKAFVISDLESRGYIFTEDSTADFVLDYVVGVFNLDESENLGPLGGTPATGPGDVDQSRYWSNSFREGLLVMELYRGTRSNVLWTSESKVELSNINIDRTLGAIVAKSFKKFPSKKKKKKK